MTKITIFEIDLNDRVQEIISGEVKQITKSNKEDIDNAIAVAKATKKVISKKEKRDKAVDDKMIKAYEMLLEAKEPVPGMDILQAILPDIPNLSAFTLRMKKYLKSNGDKYTLGKEKNAYFLREFG